MKWKALIIALILIPFVIWGSNFSHAASSGKPIKVVCTLQVFSTMAKEIGGNRVSVDYIVPQGSDIHDYSLTQRDINKINSADLIILASSEFFSVDSNIKSFATGKQVLDFNDYNATLYPLGSLQRNVHGYWMYPSNAINISHAVYVKLSEMNPDSSDYFYQNYLSFVREVQNAEKYIQILIKEFNLKNKTSLLAVPGVFYVVKTLDIGIAGSILQGPNNFISPNEISKIEDEIKEGKINFIVNAVGLEDSRAGNIAKEISKDTGVKIVYVDIFSVDNYTATLIKNSAILSSSDYVYQYPATSCNVYPYVYAIAVVSIISIVLGYMTYRYRRELLK